MLLNTRLREGMKRLRKVRRENPDRLVTMSLQLPESIVAAIWKAGRAGDTSSVHSFVEDAVRERLRRLRRDRIYAAYREAAGDPVFMTQMMETCHAFDVAAGDGVSASS